MIQNNAYTFPVSLSVEWFINKEISSAVIGTGKDETNKLLREKFGYSRGVSFRQVEVTPQTLLDQLLEGRVFCHLFNPSKYRVDGTWGMSEKTNQNFIGSYVIGVDIDKTKYYNARDYISTLTLKPTFYYTSYSNQQLGKGARFRLIYVFDERIENPYYFKYCATKLNSIIEKDTKELIEDNCNVRCSQYFNGTCKYNSSVILDYGITNNVYNLEDIGASKEDYKNFLKGGAGYKTLPSTRKQEIEQLLRGNQENALEEPETQKEPVCSPRLVEDMKRLDFDTFMKYNRHKYKYTYRQENGTWEDGTYQFTSEGYFSLYWNATKVKDGNKRRKKLFERICLRRVLDPSIDPDTLLYCAYVDRERFFEIDRDLDIDCLVRNVENALELSIEEIEGLYSENLKYLRSKKPKNSLIFKSGEYQTKRDLKEVVWSVIDKYYNPSKSVKENLEDLKGKVNICKSTLYNYLKEKGVKLKLEDEEIKELLDPKKSRRENYKILREKGVKIKTARLGKLLQELRLS